MLHTQFQYIHFYFHYIHLFTFSHSFPLVFSQFLHFSLHSSHFFHKSFQQTGKNLLLSINFIMHLIATSVYSCVFLPIFFSNLPIDTKKVVTFEFIGQLLYDQMEIVLWSSMHKHSNFSGCCMSQIVKSTSSTPSFKMTVIPFWTFYVLYQNVSSM